MLREFDPRKFSFMQEDVRPRGVSVTGGESLSGIVQTMRSDGGGRWRATFGDGTLKERNEVMQWRAMTADMDDGGTPYIVRICDARHQPGGGRTRVPHSDGTPFDGGSEYEGSTVVATASAASLRATALTVALSGQDVVGGERFTILHASWGPRLYVVVSVEPSGGDLAIKIRPPLREAIGDDTPLDFGNLRCVMQLVDDKSSPLQFGRLVEAAIEFVEYMDRPDGA
jgi:hypothetical protein